MYLSSGLKSKGILWFLVCHDSWTWMNVTNSKIHLVILHQNRQEYLKSYILLKAYFRIFFFWGILIYCHYNYLTIQIKILIILHSLIMNHAPHTALMVYISTAFFFKRIKRDICTYCSTLEYIWGSILKKIWVHWLHFLIPFRTWYMEMM